MTWGNVTIRVTDNLDYPWKAVSIYRGSSTWRGRLNGMWVLSQFVELGVGVCRVGRWGVVDYAVLRVVGLVMVIGRMKRRADCRYSGSAVRRAGKILREPDLSSGSAVDAFFWALEVMNDWRAAHSYALNSAQMGLRSRLATVGVEGSVSQRLKRRWSIVGKLRREPTMQLNTMQDIAGCRAVVPDLESAYAVLEQWHKTARKGSIRRVYDYIESPRSTGYRAIHIVAEYDDLPVEVQIRTETQHAWAVAVEDISGSHGYDLKNEVGPADLQAMFKVTADILAEYEATGTVDPAMTGDILEAITMLRQGTLEDQQ